MPDWLIGTAALFNGLYALFSVICWVTGDEPDEQDRLIAILGSLMLMLVCLDKVSA